MYHFLGFEYFLHLILRIALLSMILKYKNQQQKPNTGPLAKKILLLSELRMCWSPIFVFAPCYTG